MGAQVNAGDGRARSGSVSGGVESVGDELCGMSRSFGGKYNFRVILQ